MFLRDFKYTLPVLCRQTHQCGVVGFGHVAAIAFEQIDDHDILPTFLETMEQPVPYDWLEGRSLRPLLDGQASSVREVAISELDYAIYGAARELKLAPRQARMVMARSERFKYVHYDGLPPQLFNLHEDPQEFHDLGRDPAYAGVRDQHLGFIFDWMRQRRNRVSISDEAIMKRATPAAAGGVIIGEW